MPEHAPYDAIVTAAAAPAVPPPLVEQLAEGGRLVQQRVTLAHFVPLVGAFGVGTKDR